MRLLPSLAPWLLLATAAFAQGVLQQAGPATQGHVPAYANQSQTGGLPVVTDGGPASGGGPGIGLSELNVTARGNGSSPTAPFPGQGTGPNGEVVCVQDGPTTNATGYHYLCLSANIGGNAIISYGAGGIAAPGTLTFIINGVTVTPVTCSGTPTSSFAAINGIVTHC